MLISTPHIHKVMQELVAEMSSSMPDHKPVIVAVGGTALCINKIRLASYDIDVYCDARSADIIPAIESRFKERYGEQFRIDATSDKHCWGQVNIGDIEDSPIFKTYMDGAFAYPVRAIDPATLFIMKACSARDRDIDDVEIIKDHVSIDAILDKLSVLSETNEGLEFIEMVLSEIQAQYFEPVSKEMIDKINLDRDRKRDLLEVFMVNSPVANHG